MFPGKKKYYTIPSVFHFFIYFFAGYIHIGLAQGLQQKDTVRLRLAVPLQDFDEQNIKDARLAIDMWAKEIMRSVEEKEKLHFAVTSCFLRNKSEKVDYNGHKKYDILLAYALDFVELRLEKIWQPIAFTKSTGHFPEEYVVLSRRENNFKDIMDLRNKKVVFTKYQDNRIIRYWLEYYLQKQHLSTAKNFFSLTQTIPKASRAILSVFFKKNDACIVGYNQFLTMVELNPQIGRDLSIVTKSPPFARGMVCLKKTMDSRVKQIVKRVVLNLPNSVRGKQILSFFSQTGIIPYKSESLDSFREMVKWNQNRR